VIIRCHSFQNWLKDGSIELRHFVVFHRDLGAVTEIHYFVIKVFLIENIKVLSKFVKQNYTAAVFWVLESADCFLKTPKLKDWYPVFLERYPGSDLC